MVGTRPAAVLATTLAEPEPTILSRFARIATARAADLAVRDHSSTLSYAELDLRSSVLARALLGEGVDGPVGILLGQGSAAIIAMVGALKAGRPFVPLDPMLPPGRLGQILRLAGALVCVTEPAHADLLAAARAEQGASVDGPAATGTPTTGTPRTVLVDRAVAATSPGQDGADDLPGYRALPSDPAFVVFSSGSTGVPKGVVWRQRTVMKELEAGIELLGIDAADQVALVLPTAFAAGITVMFWGLLTGATLHPFDPRVRGIELMPRWLAERGLTTLHLTPALMRALVGAAGAGQILSELRVVTSSGEAVYGRDVAALRRLLPPSCTFYNWSGSTETASFAFFPVRSQDELPDGPLLAGWAVNGKNVEIVDEHGVPVPAGVSGLISVTSRYLSGGYWNAPEMTAARFRSVPQGASGDPTDGPLAHPAAPSDEVIYQGGDLARRRPDGCIELLGRADAAVKIRGYLVEPAEIENVLLTSPDVLEAVVVTERQDDRAPRLIAYVVCESAVKSATVAIRGLLREKLPAYMVPAAVVLLGELPRNERGKVDRPALPPPPPRRAAELPAGRSHLEYALRDLFAQLLKIDEIGMDDDFLELGGDSLIAQQLLSEVATRLGATLPTSTLVEAPTVTALAARIATAQRNLPTHPTCVPLNAVGTRPPLFCVAGAGGLALNFLALARRLGPDQPVYGLQAQGLESRAVPDWTVRRHAQRHLAVLRLIQPRGPYHLAGFSFGGLIALEMAQLLADAGEQVAMLMLLDPTLPRSARGGTDTGTGTDSGTDTADEGREGADRRLAPGPARLSGLLSRRLPQPNVNKLLKAARLPLAGLVRYPGLTQFDVFFNQGRILTQSYQVRPYDGRTVFYVAEQNPDSGHQEWARYLTGDATIVTVPGEHHTILTEPHVRVLADDLRSRLESTTTDN